MSVREKDGVGGGSIVEQTGHIGEKPARLHSGVGLPSELVGIERVAIGVEEREAQVENESRAIGGNLNTGTANSGRPAMNRYVDRQCVLDRLA